MTTTAPNLVQGRCWRQADMARELATLCYFERASAHILAGWLPKVADIDIKLRMGLDQYSSMDHAARLHRSVAAMARRHGDHDWSVPTGWVEAMKSIDGSSTVGELLVQLYLVVKQHQIDRGHIVLANADRNLDFHRVEIVESLCRAAEAQVAWAREAVTAISSEAALGEIRDDFYRKHWWGRHTDERITAEQWLWLPLDRAPRAARPDHMRSATPGQMKPRGYRNDQADHVVMSFHGNVDDEITTMELFGRCSYEHPDMPFAFHHAMARQVADESRHATACIDICRHHGVEYGRWDVCDVSTYVYDFNYEYDGCEPGSKRELLWRLLIRSTFQEALSLDGFELVIKKREFYGQEYLVRAMEAILADEVFHVQSGIRWSRYLCDGDEETIRREREAAHAFYVRSITERRDAFVQAHPETALAELEEMEKMGQYEINLYPFQLEVRLNRTARQEAGFTEEDMQQVIDWGYALP